MRFEWNEAKNRINQIKHGVSFETAVLAFDDPYALTKHDIIHDEDEERFVTLGAIGPGAILLVVHASFADPAREEVIRIISARAATSREKKSYEEAHKRTTQRNRRARGKERPRY